MLVIGSPGSLAVGLWPIRCMGENLPPSERQWYPRRLWTQTLDQSSCILTCIPTPPPRATSRIPRSFSETFPGQFIRKIALAVLQELIYPLSIIHMMPGCHRRHTTSRPHLEIDVELLEFPGADIIDPPMDPGLRAVGLLLLHDGIGEEIHAGLLDVQLHEPPVPLIDIRNALREAHARGDQMERARDFFHVSFGSGLTFCDDNFSIVW